MTMPQVLVVEDDMISGLVLTDRLSKLGYEVLGPIAKGEEAVEEVRKTTPDLVLMDVQLAGDMDGIEAAGRIRSAFGIPVVYLTAHADRGAIERAKSTEPFGYLIKPCGDRELGAAIEMALYKAEIDKRLKASEERYRRLVENAPVGILSFDVHGHVTQLNPQASKLLGMAGDANDYERDLLSCPAMADSCLAEDLQLCLQFGRAVESERSHTSREGQPICLRLHAIPVYSDEGELIGGEAIVQDVTEHRRMERLEKESARGRAIGAIADGIAHHFNNLLQLVLGHSSVALFDLEKGVISEVEGQLESIVAASLRGGEMVARLSAFAKTLEEGRPERVEVFDLSDLVMQALELTERWRNTELGPCRIITVNTSLQEKCMVSGDREDLLQVLIELIKNAAEALPEGGDIEIDTTSDPLDVTVRVKDKGIGIAGENLEGLFTPFTSFTVAMGRGLGLATCRTTVNAHGGNILVDSVEGTGSTFTVKLPRAQAELEPATR